MIRIEIESKITKKVPPSSLLHEINSVITCCEYTTLKEVKSEIEELKELDNCFKYLWFYFGGNHIAVHYITNGIPDRNRFLLITEY